MQTVVSTTYPNHQSALSIITQNLPILKQMHKMEALIHKTHIKLKIREITFKFESGDCVSTVFKCGNCHCPKQENKVINIPCKGKYL